MSMTQNLRALPGPNVLKLFTAAIYDFFSKARVFASGRLSSRKGQEPTQVKYISIALINGKLVPYPQTLD